MRPIIAESRSIAIIVIIVIIVVVVIDKIFVNG
jgi:hypothetical protein